MVFSEPDESLRDAVRRRRASPDGHGGFRNGVKACSEDRGDRQLRTHRFYVPVRQGQLAEVVWPRYQHRRNLSRLKWKLWDEDLLSGRREPLH